MIKGQMMGFINSCGFCRFFGLRDDDGLLMFFFFEGVEVNTKNTRISEDFSLGRST